MNTWNHYPQWLINIAGERERAIMYHNKVKILSVDNDGVRLPDYQQWLESPVGSMWIDSQKKQIIG